jgi:NAD(P)-dependent dehydrogenase (short-subunit alcohol dehydrogenase family)
MAPRRPPARRREPTVGSNVRRRLGQTDPRPCQQCGHHDGAGAGANRGRLRAAVRHELPRSLRVDAGLRRQLAAAKGARIVSVSSTGSLFGPVIWDDPHFHFTQYNPLLGYAQSKTACILLSVGIKERWASDGIVSNALNPGAIATNLQRHTGGLKTPEHLRKTPQQGAATSVLLAASPLVEGVNGRYFDNCQEAPLIARRPDGTLEGVAPYALDSANADRLWEMALHIVGEPK